MSENCIGGGNKDNSGNSMDVLISILNGIDAYLYVTDPETDEILFINDKMRNHFGLGHDAEGSVCWKALQSGFTERCSFCPVNSLNIDPDTPIVWEEHNTVTNRYYRNVDTIIPWTGGKKVHLQHSTDITDIKETEIALKRRLEQQELMSSISESFITENDMDAFINNALRKTGEFLGVSRIMLAEYDEDMEALKFVYAWKKEAGRQQPNFEGALPYRAGAPLYEAFMESNYQPVVFADAEKASTFKQVKLLNIKAFMALPVFVNGFFWGVLELDHCETPYNWSRSDVHLGSLLVNILAGVITRRNLEAGKRKADVEISRMTAIINYSPQYIANVNSDGDFVFFNNAVSELTGYSEEELLSGGIGVHFAGQDAGQMLSDILPVLHLNHQHAFEFPILRKDGEERVMSASIFKIESENDSYGVIASDVTDKKTLENELILAKNVAEQANKAKSDFLSRMSHEMRTPMNAIIGMTNIAVNTTDADKKDYCLSKIDNASRHLLGVINDVLDVSKIEANKFTLALHEFDFEKMLVDITNVINYKIEEKKQSFVINMNRNVPVSIIGDELHLTQVITNLLTNAVKFTPDGGSITLNIKKTNEKDGIATLQFEIVDTGIGVSKEQQSRLFTSFEQADGGIARKYGGTGLGLVICKHIVELMGGKIWIESELGKGSRFIFTVNTEQGKNQKRAKLSRHIDKEDIRVLAVDDSPEIREYFKYLMNGFGLNCDVADSGREAVEILKKNEGKPYNIFFIDWKMPEVDGIELTKQIKEIRQDNVIIIMISSATMVDIEDEATKAGVDRFIAKPLFPSSIINNINECMGVPGESSRKKSKARRDGLPVSCNLKGYTVLIAEDVEINREIMAAILENTNVTIEYAENGAEAVRIFSENHEKYDLILMDIHMPEMDGYEATRRIRALGYVDVPIIAMTANVFREDIEQCLEAGMNNHVGKPIDSDDLFCKLQLYLPEKITDAPQMEKRDLDYDYFLPYINIQDGLSRIMNNRKLYLSLLGNFKGKEMVDALANSAEANNLSETSAAAHKLRGVAANLGLSEIRRIAEDIEETTKILVLDPKAVENLKAAAEKTLTAINDLTYCDLLKD